MLSQLSYTPTGGFILGQVCRLGQGMPLVCVLLVKEEWPSRFRGRVLFWPPAGSWRIMNDQALAGIAEKELKAAHRRRGEDSH